MPDPADAVAAATHANPYPFYARLLRERPFVRDEALGTWVAASAHAVQAVLASPECRVRPPGEPVPAALAGTAEGDVFARMARMSDGAAHRARRAGASAALDALDLACASELAARWTRELWRERDGWRGDVVFHLPVFVVASLLGVADDRLPGVAAWTTAFVRCAAASADSAAVTCGAVGAARLLALLERDPVRSSPPLRALAEGLAQGGDTDPRTAAANAIALLFQSHDATAGLLGNAIVALGTHPGLLAEVRSRPDLIPQLVDEVLRHDPPVQNTRRFVAEDCIVAGHALRAGDAVLLLLAAVNRDPALNPDPDAFRIDRPDRRALTLGHGAHACPGGALARTIAAAALATMLEMRTDFAALAASHAYLPSANARIPLFT
jgi:cytochrome P450